MSTGPLCERFHTLVIFSGVLYARPASARRAGKVDAIKSELDVIQKQLWQLATRRELAGTTLAIILATMMLATRRVLFFL